LSFDWRRKATYRPAIAEGVPESTPGIKKMALEQLLGYEPSNFSRS
jgi:hypothetical protein